LAQRLRKSHELLGGEVLVAEENDLVLQQGIADLALLLSAQSLGQIDPVQLGAQGTCNSANFHDFHCVTGPRLCCLLRCLA
jgi:hypothetical protein